MLREQALEDELMRGAAAKPDVGALVLDDLVGRPVELGGQAGVAERGQRIGGDGDFVVLANGNERGHGVGIRVASVPSELTGPPPPTCASDKPRPGGSG